MKITAQEEYGLRCLLQLARGTREGGLTVKEIAKQEGLSPAYVEKLLRLMGRAGLIHSVRGMKGGYLLDRDPKEISLGSVVSAFGKLPTTKDICNRYTGNRQACIHIDDCCIRSAWATLTQAIENFMEQTSLLDLMVESEAKVRQTLGARMMNVQTRFTIDRG